MRRPVDYTDAIDSLLQVDPEDQAALASADKRASKVRRDAGILQASDDFAKALSGGAYAGARVAEPMLERANDIQGRARADVADRRKILGQWAESKQAEAMSRAKLGQDAEQKELDRRAKIEQWAAEKERDAARTKEQDALRRELANQSSEDRRYSADATRTMAAASLGMRTDAAKTAAEERAERAKTAAEERSSRDRAARYDRLTKDLGETRPSLESVAELEDIIRRNPGDVPGMGMVDSKLPGFMTGAEGQRFRQTLQGLQNAYFKEKAGGNVTGPEQTRIERFLSGSGTEAEAIEGLTLLKKLFTRSYQARTKSIREQDPDLARQLDESIMPTAFRGGGTTKKFNPATGRVE